MKSTGNQYVIFSPPDGWRIGIATAGDPRILPVPAESRDTAHVAAALAKTLRDSGHDGQPVLVALGSSSCLSASIATAGLPRRGRDHAALYRMEERLPLAAEELAAGFVFHNGTALGISARKAELAELVDALAAEQIEVAAICPTAFLSLQGLRRHPAAAPLLEADALLWQTGGRIDLLTLAEATPEQWLDLPAEVGDVCLALTTQVIAQDEAAARVATINVSQSLLRGLDRLTDVAVTDSVKFVADDFAVHAAARVLDHGEDPPVNLLGGRTSRVFNRRVRVPLVAASAAVVLFWGCLVASLLIRGAKYESLAQKADWRKSAAFRQVFPREPLPVGIESRMRAVDMELRGASRIGKGDEGNAATDALGELHELLRNLPSGVRYRITELDVDDGRLSVGGEVSTHGDADAVATALRRSPEFAIEDPQTQQLDGNVVRFSINGRVRPAGELAAGGKP